MPFPLHSMRKLYAHRAWVSIASGIASGIANVVAGKSAVVG